VFLCRHLAPGQRAVPASRRAASGPQRPGSRPPGAAPRRASPHVHGLSSLYALSPRQRKFTRRGRARSATARSG